MTPPVIEIADVSKSYGGLRPLRIQQLMLSPAERVAILGMDQPMAEVFVNLVTGAGLPERGSVRVFGQATSDITDSAEWLTLVDRFGIVSERAVLLEGMTLLQNLALPFSLEIEPMSDETRLRAAALAAEVGLSEAEWDEPVAELNGASRARARLARALALDPAVLLLEHPTAAVGRQDVPPLAECFRGVAERRGVAAVALTADHAFAGALGGRVVTLDGATGRLTEQRVTGWFRRWLG